MAVRRSKNYWAYKQQRRRRHVASTAIHEARWGKAVAALLICLATFFIVLTVTSMKNKQGGAAQAAITEKAVIEATQPQNTPPPTGQDKMGLALVGDNIQQTIEGIQTPTQQPTPEATAEPTPEPSTEPTPAPDADLPDVDVPIINKAPKEGAAPAVALTFDDGPHNITTARLLDILKEHNVKATFFTVAHDSPNTDRTLKRIPAEGHELGNHTKNHLNLRSLSDEEQFEQLDFNQQLNNSVGGQGRYIRPPYGKYDKRVKHYAKENGCSIITWSIDPQDYLYKDDEDGAQKIADAVLADVKDGDIILLHDIHAKSVDAAEIIINELSNRGFQMLTVHELINR